MSRLRRIVNRFLGWLIGVFASLLAILLLILAIYVLFFDYPDHIKAWMEAEASRILGREVRIQQFSVNIPNSFELRGVSALPRESGPPWLEFKSLRAELKLLGILQREIQLSLLQVDGLTVRIQDYGGGQIDLPGLWGPPMSHPSVAGEVSFAVLADRIRFEDASFVYNNHNLPWHLEATDLTAQLDREGRRGYRGSLTYEQGELKIKNRPSFEGAIRAQMELVGKEFRLKDLQALGSFYTVRAEGTVSLGAQPQAQFSLEAESRVTPAARSLLGLPQLEDDGSSPATFVGELSMGRGWHEIRGLVEVPAARFVGIPLRSWKGDIYWDRSILEVSSARGALAGGASELQIRQPLPVAEHPARVAIQLQGVPLQDLVHAATGETGPLASSISGTVNLLVPSDASRGLRGEFELTGNAPDRTGIEFAADGEVDGGDFQISRGQFVSDIAEGRLSGSYPLSGPADLHLDVTFRDIARADRIQQAVRNLFHREAPAGLLGLGGSGRTVGRVKGRFPRLVFEGDFHGADVSFRTATLGHVEARGRWSKETIRFESLQARVDNGALSGTGELTLGPGIPDWAIEGYVRDWSAAELIELIQLPIPLEGELSVEGKLSSRDGQMKGEAAASVAPGSLYAIALDQAEASIHLQGQRITLENLSIARQEARLEGRLVFDRETREIGGKLVSRRFPIAVFGTESLNVEGEMEAKLELGGDFGQPDLTLEADISSVALGGTPMGDARLEARIEAGTARASLSVRGDALELEGRSQTRLLPGYPTEGELRWQRADIGPWLRSVPAGLPASLHFLSDGVASFTGQIDSLESFSAEAVMENIDLEVGGYRLTSSSPMRAHLRQGIVRIDDLLLAGADTQVMLAGELPLRKGDLDLVAKGSVDLDIVEGFYPSLSSSGRVELSARLRGNWDRPSLSGFADLSSGVVRVQEFPQALGDIHGRVSFDNRTIRFPSIRARFGGAPVTLTGTLLLRGLSPDSFELGFVGQGLRLRYPEGLVATLNADLRVSGTSQSQLLRGQIGVSDATWSREYDLATGILVSRDTEGLGLLEELDDETPLSNLKFDVEVAAPGTLRIQNSRATVDAQAEFQMRGTFTHPVLLGRVEAVRGELFLLGQRYQLVSGRVEFLDPSSIKPFFDLVAESRVRSYRVELRLNGTPDRFFPELTSDPPLRTVDILRLLAGASERDILIGSEEEEIAGVGVASLLTERLTQEVGRRAERLFGLDRFSIDPFLVGQFANPTARVSVGKQIYRDLSVNYSTNLNAATETLILVEYTPEGPVSWIISRDEEGAWGVDLRFRKSF